MKTICVANQKGGTGKTTTTFNVAGALAEIGKRVLVIDFDPQGGLTVSFGFNPRHMEPIIGDVLLDAEATPLSRAIVPTKFKKINLVPANKHLATHAKNIDTTIPGWHELLKEQIDEQIRREYDYILVDTQPDLTLLSTIALYAADFTLIPFQCEYLSMNALSQLLEFIETVKERINPQLDYRVMFTMFTGRTTHEREVAEEIQGKLDGRVLSTAINKTIRFADATAANTPLVLLEPQHKGAEAYRQAIKELNL